MKKILLSSLIIAISIIMFISCGPAKVSVDIVAEAVETTDKSIDMGNGIVVEEYKVVFYKIELGNSEEDKFTLWENETGVEHNLAAGQINFDDENPVVPGDYKFCRITIDKTINLAGTYETTPKTASVDITGNFGMDGDKAIFLFGTADAPGSPAGNFLLANEVNVLDGTKLSLTVDITDTVTVNAGTVNLTAPVIYFTDTPPTL